MGAAAGVGLATLGVANVGLGLTNIADSFRSKDQKAMTVPGSVVEGIASSVAKRLGDKEGKKGAKVGMAVDLVSGGAPKTAVDKVLTAINIFQANDGLLGDHTSNVKKDPSKMQQDNTRVAPVKPKVIVKDKKKTETQQPIIK